MQFSPATRRWLLGAGLGLLAGALGFIFRTEGNPPTLGNPERPPARLPEVATAQVIRTVDGSGAGEKGPMPPEAVDEAACRALFTFVEPATAITSALSMALPAPSQEIHYVQVDPALLNGKGSPFWRPPGVGRLRLPLPRSGELIIVIDATDQLGPRRFTSVGRIAGRPASRAVFAVTDTFLHATIEDPVLGSFALRVATEELSQFYRVDPERVAPCGGSKRPPSPSASAAVPAPPRLAAGPGGAAVFSPVETAAAGHSSGTEIHVMMVYGEAVLPTLTGSVRAAAVQSAFDAAIARVNVVFEASLITARVRLVRVHETRYNESLSAGNKVQDEALTALQSVDDGLMDEIHALRDQAGADIVCLALQRPDFASSGLSFLLTPDRTDNDEYPFSIVQYSNIAGTHVLAHEFGHVLGCAHDRQNAQEGDGAFSYSHGYRFIGADGRQYHDIMAYPPGIELGYFSNPDVMVPTPVASAIGIAVGRAGESNTARTIEQTAFLTAAYRLQTQAASNPGVLLNVATRAFVGRDEQVLIGGFVIGGAEPKRLLVRGAGPSLSQFGVPDALVNPLVRVFGGPYQLAENDDWSSEIGLRTAASQVGAFPFLEGSADSALLVTLPPGAYTAILEGVAGATGSGLVEVYDIDRGANKVVNLSTRGYAGLAGREMVGGFVVDSAPGATKRILVRVLGPSLARAPFSLTSTLDDPVLELRDSRGDLILTSDDWSNDSVGGVSEDNDFRPRVKSYGERQIFATGYAPGNRREPCVLVDLTAGSYTVVVRPFEQRSADAFFDQPAQPGVGIIEVYEINP